jgi:hypothetical protein
MEGGSDISKLCFGVWFAPGIFCGNSWTPWNRQKISLGCACDLSCNLSCIAQFLHLLSCLQTIFCVMQERVMACVSVSVSKKQK